MKQLQFWRIWTRGWGPRDWWAYVRREGFAFWLACHLPRKVAYWAFIRVVASTGDGPGPDFDRIAKHWEARG